MPQAEPIAPAAPAAAAPLPGPERRARLHGWGGGPGALATVLAPAGLEELQAMVSRLAPGQGAAIPRGMGRAYGDAAQLSGGTVLHTRGLRALALDPATGILTAQAGVTLGEILDHTVPAGWTVPVLPGTQHVSVGGAIAADIHGKNHGSAGTFTRHVERLGLLKADGELVELGPEDALFQATAGGMGLTGVIVWARIRLRAVRSALVAVDTDRVSGLDGILDALRAPGGPHRVAWVDLLAARPRGVVTRAEEAGSDAAAQRPRAAPTVPARATVPERWPSALLRAGAVRAFNELRFRTAPRRARGHLESIGAHMFPLDALAAWPRLYGPPGFVQYQFAVPPERAQVLEQVIARLRSSRVPCFLCVLKDFGPAGPAPLSFPIEGWTITLDLPRAAPALYPTLDACDELVLAGGGRVYLAKDDRLRPDALAAMYPRLEEWRAVREAADPERVWCSDLALRTGLIAGAAS
jgi:decaprenylphospho-beta-D-ribofuranose 2-oxidase